MWYIHMMEYYSVIKKNKMLFAAILDGPRDYHIKWSKSDRERQIPHDVIYMWNLKHDTNEFVYETNRLRDIENKLYHREMGVGKDKIRSLGLSGTNY